MLARVLYSGSVRGIRLNVFRANSSGQNEGSTPPIEEDHVHEALRKHFPKATFIHVDDMSGGCGAMFDVSIQAYEFKGVPVVKQHRMVNDALKDLIKNMHGIQIRTTAPPDY